MVKVIQTFQAKLDFADMTGELAKNMGWSAAEAFARSLKKKFATLEVFPFGGTSAPSLGAGIRQHVLHPNYIAYYEVVGNEVHILRVKPAVMGDAFFGETSLH